MAELIDKALTLIEERVNQWYLCEAEDIGDDNVYETLSHLSLPEKLDELLSCPVDELEEEDGSRCCWQMALELHELRHANQGVNFTAAITDWLKQADLNDFRDYASLDPDFQSELILRDLLEILCTYLDAWMNAALEPDDRPDGSVWAT